MHIQSLRLLHDSFPTKNFYPFNLDIFQKSDVLEFFRPVTFFIGENGSGKSTLLRAIARGSTIHIWEEREGNRDHHNLYEDLSLPPSGSNGLTGKSRVASSLPSEIFRHFTEILDMWGMADPACLNFFGNSSLVLKSHGQSHMTFFENRFRRKGLYLLERAGECPLTKDAARTVTIVQPVSSAGEMSSSSSLPIPPSFSPFRMRRSSVSILFPSGKSGMKTRTITESTGISSMTGRGTWMKSDARINNAH